MQSRHNMHASALNLPCHTRRMVVSYLCLVADEATAGWVESFVHAAGKPPGWESYLRFCRKGLTGVPMCNVFDVDDLKPEALHTIIKTVALMSDLSEAMGHMMDPAVDVQDALYKSEGWYKPQAGSTLAIGLPSCALLPHSSRTSEPLSS